MRGVLAFTAIVAVATGVIFGLVPAWRGASSASQALAIDSRTSVGGSGRVRAALVIADLVLALILLAGAGLMLRTMASLTRTSPGFSSERILTLQFSLVGEAYAKDPAVVAFQNRALERLRALPGVESAALADEVPFGGNYDCRGFHAQGRMKANTVDDPCIERYGVTPEYARLMGIPLRRGRFISAEDTSTSQPVLVVSESTAKLVWGSDDPIGSQVRLGGPTDPPWYTVVGVVGDVHHEDVTQPVTAAMYTAETQFTDSYLFASVKPAGDPVSLTTPVRPGLRELNTSVPVYGIATLPALVRGVGPARVVMQLLAGFATVAVVAGGDRSLHGVVCVASRSGRAKLRACRAGLAPRCFRLVLYEGLGPFRRDRRRASIGERPGG